jgi:glutamate synthase domain-containing protein 3
MTPAEVLVPEIRDYHAINAEVLRLLDSGVTRIRLAGVDRQRLLLTGLSGSWRSSILVDGPAGPELAAGLDAPDLTVIAVSDVDDGAAARMRAGRLLILGDADDAVAAGLLGGLVVVAGRAGHRAGARQRGGVLAIGGPSGRLAGDRRSGGRIWFAADSALAPLGRGFDLGPSQAGKPWNGPGERSTLEDRRAFEEALAAFSLPRPSKGWDDLLG